MNLCHPSHRLCRLIIAALLTSQLSFEQMRNCVFFPLQKFEQRSKTGWIGHVSISRCFVVGEWSPLETLSVHLQYGPLPLFFAEDQLSFYKVMSDTRGYKHIHLVKDVRMACLTYEALKATPELWLRVRVVFTEHFLFRAKPQASPQGSGKSSTSPN